MSVSFEKFLELVKKFSENTTLEISPKAPVDEVFYDDLCQFDFEEFLNNQLEWNKSNLFEKFDCSLTLTDFYEHLFDSKVARKSEPYFKRLLQGLRTF
jgi:hypothetical protein